MNIVKSISSRLHDWRCLLRSYSFCFRYLPFEQAKQMPFFLNGPVRLLELSKGDIVLKGDVHPRMVWIGGGVDLGQPRGIILEINPGGKLIFEGFIAVAVDALSPFGGTPADEDKARDLIGQLDKEKNLKNYLMALDYLRSGR